MQLHGQQIIGGQALAAGNGQFHAVDPATGQRLEPGFAEATVEQVDRACAQADKAFETMRRKTPAEKSALLRQMADAIAGLGEELVLRAMIETGLPRARIEMERGRTCNQLRMFADVVEEGSWVEARIDRALPDRTPLPRPDIRRMLIPIGPVAVFGASNFPLAFSVGGGDSASALAAGCPVICKGHPGHPGTSELVARACMEAVEQCGFPAGTFALLQGAGHEVGLALVRHPAIKAVGFTGSLRGGRALYDEAARREEPIPVYAEMGSTNPVFILPGAMRSNSQTIAQGLVASMTLGVGQFCTKPGMVFFGVGTKVGCASAHQNPELRIDKPEAGGEKNAAAEFVEQVSNLLSSAAPGIMLHAGIAANFDAGAHRLAEMPGVKAAVAPAPHTLPGCARRPLLFLTHIKDLQANPQIAHEVFGPSTLLVEASSRDEILSAARSLHGHLTATIHGTPEDLRQWADLLDILQTRVGRIIFNGWPTGVEVCPSMQHGGPYPATTFSHFTSVGTAAILRWARPVAFQGFPQESLREELRDGNPRGLWRMVNGTFGRE